MALRSMAGFFANFSHAFTPTEQPEAGDRFTLQELRRLHSVLTENTTVNGAVPVKLTALQLLC